MNKLHIKKVLLNLDTLLSAIALVMIILVTFIGVIARYILSKPFAWEEEVQLGLIVWVVFLGARYAFITGNHPAIDMIVELFPKKFKNIVTVVITIIAVAVLLYTGFQGLKYVLQMLHTHRGTNMLKIPYSLIYAPLPIGCVLMSGQMIVNTMQKIKSKNIQEVQ
ncbi:MAG: TRAP transporter small permease [Treponema sp.]|nr:TRAP transporter small permease [Treponema sp.]